MSQNKNNKEQPKEGKGGNSKLIILIGSLIIILLLGIIVLLLLKDRGSGVADSGRETQNSDREVVSSVRTVLDETTASNVYEEMRQEVEEGMFECNMSMEWNFENGTTESKDACVINSSNNTFPIYFDVYLKDSDELIYSSPVIPVGGQLTDFKLDQSLPAGTYKAVCKYSLIRDIESQEKVSSAGFVITINIHN